jgi:hypothetical protein
MINLKNLAATLVAFGLLGLSINRAEAGLFNVEDYFTGGTLSQTSNKGFIDFDDVNGNNIFDQNDLVMFIQDFSSIGGSSVNGTAPMPASVWGVTLFKAGVTEDASFTHPFLGTVNRERNPLQAAGGSTFSGILQALGVTPANLGDVSFDDDTAFALLSSATDVNLTSNGLADFSSFEVDLLAGLTGSSFATAEHTAPTPFNLVWYDASDSFISANDPVFSFRYGFNITSTDTTLTAGSITATDFDSSTGSVNIALASEPSVSLAQNYGDSANTDAYYGSIQASLLIGSTVPEPSSIFIVASVAGLGLLGRRRK